ncbi:MAG: zinc-binding dehydrogenase [Candidatus Tectomicrobia bacterium]|nr:zinc-binding dehydrogenase [Candidatus Tectomicrobia bacterium]
MKAAYITEQGGIDKFIYGDLPEPKIDSHDVLIRVRACSLNRVDLFTRAGEKGVKITQFPFILGRDFAGEITEVGDHATKRFKVGDRVVALTGSGGYAEYAKAPADSVHLLPGHLSYDEAATIPTCFLTAWHMLMSRAQIKPGEDVLIMAAGSGVGSAAIQVAKLMSDRVIVTAGTDEKIKKAKELGADEGINYNTEDFSKRVKELTNGEGVDVIIDHIGASVWEQNFASLKRGGRFVTCGVTGGHRVELHLGQLFTKQLSLMGSSMGTPDEMKEVMKLFHQKKLKGVVDTAFPLKDAAKAHKKLEDRDVFGKIVVNP